MGWCEIMSQYFLAANIRKRQYIAPQDFGSYGKENEFLNDPLFCRVVCYLLTRSFPGDSNINLYNGALPELKGSWSGNIVRIVGEYDPLVVHTYEEILMNWECISRPLIHELCIIDGFLTLEELSLLEYTYAGDYNKEIRKSIHIAQTYRRKRNSAMEATV